MVKKTKKKKEKLAKENAGRQARQLVLRQNFQRKGRGGEPNAMTTRVTLARKSTKGTVVCAPTRGKGGSIKSDFARWWMRDPSLSALERKKKKGGVGIQHACLERRYKRDSAALLGRVTMSDALKSELFGVREIQKGRVLLMRQADNNGKMKGTVGVLDPEMRRRTQD